MNIPTFSELMYSFFPSIDVRVRVAFFYSFVLLSSDSVQLMPELTKHQTHNKMINRICVAFQLATKSDIDRRFLESDSLDTL